MFQQAQKKQQQGGGNGANSRVRPKRVADYVPYHDAYHEYIMDKLGHMTVDDEERKMIEQSMRGSQGAAIYKRMVDTLVNTKRFKLLPYQFSLVEMCLVPALAGIYGEEFERDPERVKREHGITEFFSTYTHVLPICNKYAARSLVVEVERRIRRALPLGRTRPQRRWLETPRRHRLFPSS
jgi:hypothetical protein